MHHNKPYFKISNESVEISLFITITIHYIITITFF